MSKRRERIAIIGSGAAGLGAAWLLDPLYEITLYEAGPALGGHACTIDYPTPSGPVPVDMGVIYTANPRYYPNMFELLQMLEVTSFTRVVDFGASFGPVDSWLAGGRLKSPLWERIAGECSRFEVEIYDLANLPARERRLPIGHHLRARGYSEEFMYKAFCPAAASLVVNRSGLLELPTDFVIMMFQELISFFAVQPGHLLCGGTREYIRRLAAGLKGEIRLETPVASVRRRQDRVLVEDAYGGQGLYDQVVIATNADQARALLADPSALEGELLGAFAYHPATVYLHGDRSVLSPYLPASTTVQYAYFGGDIGPVLRGAFTVNMGALLDVEGPLVTVQGGASEAAPPTGIIAVRRWAHNLVTPSSLAARDRLHEIQGTHRTWFCGAYTAHASHEAALVSGMIVAEALGAEYPFASRPLAAQCYACMRSIVLPWLAEQGEAPPSGARDAAKIR